MASSVSPLFLFPRADLDRPITVKVSHASLNYKDVRIANADPFLVRLYAGLLHPFPRQHGVLGCDFAGVVHAVHGTASTDLAVGDRVMGCIDEGGGAAEYVNAASRHLARVPAGGLARGRSLRRNCGNHGSHCA